MWIIRIIAVILLISASHQSPTKTVKCLKCESSQGDCTTGECEGVWCIVSILENKATGTRSVKKDCNAISPTGKTEDGCVKDPIPESSGGESYRCACNSDNFCNSETNVARMKEMLNNRFIVGGGPTGGAGGFLPAGNSGGPIAGSPQNQPLPGSNPQGASNQFPPLQSQPNGQFPNGTLTENNFGQQSSQGFGGSNPNQSPNGQPTDFGGQQNFPNNFNPSGSQNNGQQFQNGNSQFPSSNSNGNSQFPPPSVGNANPQSNSPFSPQGPTNNQFPPQNGPNIQQGGSNIQNGPNFQQSGSNSPNPQNPQIQTPQNPQISGSNPQNPQSAPNSQFPSSGSNIPPNAGNPGQPDFGNNVNAAFGVSTSTRPIIGNQPNQPTQTSNTNSNSATLTCSCNEPTCPSGQQCKGAVCYKLTFPATSVQNIQAFSGKQGDVELAGCTDDTNVLLGGAQHLTRQVNDHRFRVNGQDVIIPKAQGYYCRDGDFCNSSGAMALTSSFLLIFASIMLAFQRH